MDYENQPLIPPGNIWREARVSEDKGGAALKKLEEEGVVHPTRTPTRRTLLTPADGRRLWEALRASV